MYEYTSVVWGVLLFGVSDQNETLESASHDVSSWSEVFRRTERQSLFYLYQNLNINFSFKVFC